MGDPVLPRNDRGKAGPHRDIGRGFTICRACLLGLPCARAPRPSAATCGPGQPVPGGSGAGQRHQPLTARPNLPFPPGRITLPTDRWPEICEPEGADIGKLSEWVYAPGC